MLELLLVKGVWRIHGSISEMFAPAQDDSLWLALLCIIVVIPIMSIWYVALERWAKADAKFRTEYVLWQIAILRDLRRQT